MNQLPFLKKYIIYMPYFPWSSSSVIDKNVGYGLRVKRKEKYLYIRNCDNITNNYKKRNSRK